MFYGAARLHMSPQIPLPLYHESPTIADSSVDIGLITGMALQERKTATTGNAQPQNPKRQNAGKANDQTMTGIMTDHRAALSPDLSGNVPFLSPLIFHDTVEIERSCGSSRGSIAEIDKAGGVEEVTDSVMLVRAVEIIVHPGQDKHDDGFLEPTENKHYGCHGGNEGEKQSASLRNNMSNVQKSGIYENFNAFCKVPGSLLIIDKVQHGFRRRITSHALTVSANKSMEDLILDNIRDWFGKLVSAEMHDTAEPANREWSVSRKMANWLSRLTFDIVGDLSFGRG
ncbi:MAG: hypothetical protein Q9188_001430 [Gyalolechia gomerana]